MKPYKALYSSTDSSSKMFVSLYPNVEIVDGELGHGLCDSPWC